MSDVAGRRLTAEIEGDFVVLLIGARFNSKLQLGAAPRSGWAARDEAHLDYLVAHPEKGLLAYEMGLPTIVEYWRSFEQLEEFARNEDDPHLDVWRQYWLRVGRPSRTGIWHETFLVKEGQYEPSTETCPRTGWARPGGSCPCRSPRALESAEGPQRVSRAAEGLPSFP